MNPWSSQGPGLKTISPSKQFTGTDSVATAKNKDLYSSPAVCVETIWNVLNILEFLKSPG